MFIPQFIAPVFRELVFIVHCWFKVTHTNKLGVDRIMVCLRNILGFLHVLAFTT